MGDPKNSRSCHSLYPPFSSRFWPPLLVETKPGEAPIADADDTGGHRGQFPHRMLASRLVRSDPEFSPSFRPAPLWNDLWNDQHVKYHAEGRPCGGFSVGCVGHGNYYLLLAVSFTETGFKLAQRNRCSASPERDRLCRLSVLEQLPEGQPKDAMIAPGHADRIPASPRLIFPPELPDTSGSPDPARALAQCPVPPPWRLTGPSISAAAPACGTHAPLWL